MESTFKPPESLVLDGNISENWRKFSQKFDLFMIATDLTSKPESKKLAVFLSLVGDEALELYNTFTFDENEDRTVTCVKKKFEEYCSPKKNVIFERFKFNSISQQEGQPFDSFVTELRKAIKTTEYSQQDQMIRDRIVMGIHNKATQEKLLRESELTLMKAVDICRAIEISKDQSKMLQNESLINAVQRREPRCDRVCTRCGYNHLRDNRCPAWGKTCAKCQGHNHFAKVCREDHKTSGSNVRIKPEIPRKAMKEQKKKVHQVTEASVSDVHSSGSESEGSEYQYFVRSVNSKCKHEVGQDMWSADIYVNNKPVSFKLDTGAEVSTLPLSILKEIAPTAHIHKSNISLVSYGDSKFKIKTVGRVTLTCVIKNDKKDISFVVVDTKNQVPLLGFKECIELNLVKRVDSLVSSKFKNLNDLVTKYAHVFEGLGKFPTKHHITLREDTKPRISTIRRVPHALRKRLKK
ncbi:uncharacterized protein [Diabrotica undecimpunctata]|uniref:uncharacterized protein n=1 Tax=Diabrotica undecimpunctata TaxID=50387 RepID=UPI003B635C74